MLYLNIIKSYRDVVAICDEELLGKKFEQDNKELNLKENFYSTPDTKPISEEQAQKIMENQSYEDATFNIVGKRSITLALELGLIGKDSIKEIQGIPYSLVLM